MAQVNASYQLAEYVSDFGGEFPSVPLKFGNNVEISLLTDLGYSLRPDGQACGSTGFFDLRFLRATFGTGEVHQFPVNRDSIVTAKTTLVAAGAVCIDLVGEKHTILTPKDVGELTYSADAAYLDIPKRGKKKTYVYKYNSDVLTAEIDLNVAVEIEPEALNTAQTSCLGETSDIGAICSGAGLGIKPRHLILFHRSINQVGTVSVPAKVVRNINISLKEASDIISCAEGAASAALCFGYQGESIKNLENLI